MKNLFLFALPNLLRRLHSEQAGTALTEFAITLPVYLLFFAGIVSFHQVQQAALMSHQKASAELWKEAVHMQTTRFTDGYTPLAGVYNAADYYSRAGETFGIAHTIDTVTSVQGMYADSHYKVWAMDKVLLADLKSESKLAPKVMNEKSHAYKLMDDRVQAPSGGGSGVLRIVSMALDMTGARPAIAAGVRYGVVGGVDKDHYDVPFFDNSRPKARYNASAPTYPEERWAALALTRIEMANTKAYNELLAFGNHKFGTNKPPRAKAPGVPDGPGNCDGGGGVEEMSEEEKAFREECQRRAEKYESCYNGCSGTFKRICRLRCKKPPKRCKNQANSPADLTNIKPFELPAGGGSC